MTCSTINSAIFVGTLSFGFIVAAAQNPPSMPREARTTQITGQPPASLKISFGDKSITWTPAQLAAMPQTSLTVYNEHTKASETYTGVPLMNLLTQLGVPAVPHSKEMRLYPRSRRVRWL